MPSPLLVCFCAPALIAGALLGCATSNTQRSEPAPAASQPANGPTSAATLPRAFRGPSMETLAASLLDRGRDARLALDERGGITVAGRLLKTEAELELLLRACVKREPNVRLLIRAEPKTPNGRVVFLLTVAKRAGIRRIGIDLPKR